MATFAVAFRFVALRPWLQVSMDCGLHLPPVLAVYSFIFTSTISMCNGGSVNNNLAMKLDNVIFDTHPNVSLVMSTLAIHFPLCKLASIAAGRAKDELLSVLGYKSANQLRTSFDIFKEPLDMLTQIDFVTFNKIFVNYTDDINSTFIYDPVVYGTQMEKVGYNLPQAAASFINTWVDRTTYKRISDIIKPEELNNNQSIIMINGAYLKVTWEIPFDIRMTRGMIFHHANGAKSRVPMMTRTDMLLYVHDNLTNIQFINLRLASYQISITFGIGFEKYDLSRLLQKLSSDPAYMANIYNRMGVHAIDLKIPRFKIKTQLDVTKYLKEIGLNKIFNKTDSGLNSILNKKKKTKKLHLSKVKQMCFIEVDEMGVYRQPLDSNDYHQFGKMEPRGKQIIADGPFYFSINIQTDIEDRYNLHQLLTGVYRGPETDWTLVT